MVSCESQAVVKVRTVPAPALPWGLRRPSKAVLHLSEGDQGSPLCLQEGECLSAERQRAQNRSALESHFARRVGCATSCHLLSLEAAVRH
jgi:hypothetical protein